MKLSESKQLPAASVAGEDSGASRALGTPDTQALLNPGGKGRFAITIDPQEKGGNTYQGIVPLEGNTVARMLERYMFRSEQLPTKLWLAADEHRVAGLLLQKMPLGADGPHKDSDGWNRLQRLAGTLDTAELLSTDAPKLLHRLFWQEQLGKVQSSELRFACQCTRTRVTDMLRMLGQTEVQSIIDEQGKVSVNCEYCNSPYEFDPVDCATLFAQDNPARAVPGTDTRQ